MKIAFGCDHAGFGHKSKIIDFLNSQNNLVTDFGCFGPESCDYPDIAAAVSLCVSGGKCEKGILICGTGIGMSIVANKFPGVRAAVCWNSDTASLVSEHNDANILCLPARFASPEQMIEWIDIWLKTPRSREQRHLRRIEKIAGLEKSIKVSGGKR